MIGMWAWKSEFRLQLMLVRHYLSAFMLMQEEERVPRFGFPMIAAGIMMRMRLGMTLEAEF